MLYKRKLFLRFIPYYVVATNREVKDYVYTTMFMDNELTKKIKSYEALS